MTIKERIIQYLQQNSQGVDDDTIAQDLGLSYRQQANSRCRELEAEGLIERRKVQGKIHNFWVGVIDYRISEIRTKSRSQRLWYWERNVQAKVINQLVKDGYDIISVANTEERQRGKDIIASKAGVNLWVTVKGFPAGTQKTRPSTQAGHWFKQAVFDIIEYRSENESVKLAIGFPDFKRYRDLANKISWFKEAADFSYYWVKENGNVLVDK